MFKKTTLITAVAALVFTGSADAGLVTIAGVTGSNDGDNYGDNYGGHITDTINGSGMDGNPETGGPYAGSDPSTWEATSNHYQSEF